MRSLGTIIAHRLPELQVHAESMMQDACRVERRRRNPDGSWVETMDPDSLEITYAYDLVAEGKCRVKPMEASALSKILGEVEHLTSPHTVWRPLYEPTILEGGTVLADETVLADATFYRPGDRVTITSVGPVGDLAMVGAVLWVVAVPRRSHATKRELACSEVDPLAN